MSVHKNKLQGITLSTGKLKHNDDKKNYYGLNKQKIALVRKQQNSKLKFYLKIKIYVVHRQKIVIAMDETIFFNSEIYSMHSVSDSY